MVPVYVTHKCVWSGKGRMSARQQMPYGLIWAKKEGSWLRIDRPGRWLLHATDGRRTERAELIVQANGTYELSGGRFRVDVDHGQDEP